MEIKKILIITADYPPPYGGIPTLTRNLEKELINNGYTVKLLNFDSRNTNNLKMFKIRDLIYTKATFNFYFNLITILNPLNLFKLEQGYRDFVYHNLIFRASQEHIASFKPDLIHITHPKLYSAVYNIKVPFVVTCHSEEIKDTFPIRYVLKKAAKIHCISKYSKRIVLKINPSRKKDIIVIHNSINIKIYKKNKKERIDHLITISRLEKSKNIESIIKAYSLWITFAFG